MASITKREGPRGPAYLVRYRDPFGKTRNRTFSRRRDADRFASTIEADKVRGDWLDPTAGAETFAAWAAKWMATTSHLKPSTLALYRGALDRDVLPVIGHLPVVAVDYATVSALVAGMLAAGLSPGSARQARQTVRSTLDLARRSGAVRTNAVEGVRLPMSRPPEMVFLNASQVVDLADAIGAPPIRTGGGEHRRESYPEYSLLVRFTAYTGLRAGEVAGLTVGRLDLMRRSVEVVDTLAEVNGALVAGTPKTNERRGVPIPAALVDELAEHVGPMAKADYVFSAPNGGPLRHRAFYGRHYKPAVLAAETVPDACRFHDLRHTYAALLVSQGSPPLAVMRRMGHSSITVTLGTYGHLFPEMDAAIDDAMDATYRAATATPPAAVRRIA